MDFLYVFLGGGLGSVCRYGIARLLAHGQWQLPIATISANVVACLTLGIIMGLATRNAANENVLLFLAVGFCGGFSTFSTFSLENVQLWQAGAYWAVLANIALSVIVCFVCVFAGMKVVQ